MKWDTLLYGLLFSGLGAFSYLLLVNYTDLSDLVADILYSQGAFIYFIAAFNVLGYSMLRLDQYAICPEYSSALEVDADVFGRNVAFPAAELWFTGGR